MYNFFIHLATAFIWFVSFFWKKAALWQDGQKDIFGKISRQISPNESRVWFHAASLGEFEQGRPLMEAFRLKYPDYKIILTFFSPSGYEVRKNYQGADYIFYLPPDTPKNALKFLKILQPKFAFFIKYEFWRNYLKTLKKMNIPTFLVSGIFRKNQVFFKFWGSWFRKILHCFSIIYVQNSESARLLHGIGLENVRIAPDTRFDRVLKISLNVNEIELIKIFCNNKKTVVIGSSWENDENILIPFINSDITDTKYIIAPHEISEKNVNRILNKIKKPAILFSQANVNTSSEKKVIILDNIGMLSAVYKYANIAYVGGGFGKGIHNLLEAAVFGIPVVFGPNYTKFQEASDLLKLGAGFSVVNYDNLASTFNLLLSNSALSEEAGMKAAKYIKDNTGGTELIMSGEL